VRFTPHENIGNISVVLKNGSHLSFNFLVIEVSIYLEQADSWFSGKIQEYITPFTTNAKNPPLVVLFIS
jgi:hypothetical protein